MIAALGAALGAVIGHRLQQQRIAREEQRRQAWADYYARQAAPR